MSKLSNNPQLARKSPLTKSSSNHLFNSKDNRFSIWLRTFCKGFGLLLTYEIIEELIEEAIAYTITTIIAKAVSFILVVVLTQTVKVTAKGLAKGITIALKPAVKKLTYKEGNDKVNKLLRFINMCKEKIKENKFLNFLKRNPKSIVGILVGLIASIASGGATTCGLVIGNVELPLWAEICIGVVICVALFVCIALGVTGAGFENSLKQKLRLLAEKLGFGQAVEALDKAEAEYEAEEEAKAEAERLANEKEQERYKEAWRLAIVQRKFDGSLEEFIAVKQEEEAEAKAKQEEAEKEQALARAKTEFINAVANNGYIGSFENWQAEQNK